MYILDLNDFDNTVIKITFEPDEGAPDNECAAPIPVVNDLINEADEQVFIVELRLISSTNPAGIDLTIRPASLCRITNDDSKPNSVVNYVPFSGLILYYYNLYYSNQNWF